MDAIAIVDGTGVWNNGAYDKAMANSFCRQLETCFAHCGMSAYERGPSGEGYRFDDKAEWAALKLEEFERVGATRFFLAGYSRGAAIALRAATVLWHRGAIQIDGLFLLDPVVRWPSRTSFAVEGIPQNVKRSRVAHRDLDPLLYQNFEGVIKPRNLTDRFSESLPQLGGNPIRPGFGRFRTIPCSIGDHAVKDNFVGSHGALGGVGWADLWFDNICQNAVAAFMNEGFRAAGLHRVELKSVPPTSRFDQ